MVFLSAIFQQLQPLASTFPTFSGRIEQAAYDSFSKVVRTALKQARLQEDFQAKGNPLRNESSSKVIHLNHLNASYVRKLHQTYALSKHMTMTMHLKHKIYACTRDLSNGRLLIILRCGDVVAHELKCHPACLVGLFSRERANVEQRKERSSL